MNRVNASVCHRNIPCNKTVENLENTENMEHSHARVPFAISNRQNANATIEIQNNRRHSRHWNNTNNEKNEQHDKNSLTQRNMRRHILERFSFNTFCVLTVQNATV